MNDESKSHNLDSFGNQIEAPDMNENRDSRMLESDSVADDNMKRVNKIELISGIIMSLLLLIYSFMPIVKIGSSSLGNAWEGVISYFSGFGNGNIMYSLYANILVGSMSLTVCGMLFVSVANLIFTLSVRKNKKWHYKNAFPKWGVWITVVIFILATVAAEIVFSYLFDIFSYSNLFFMAILAIFILKYAVVFVVTQRVINSAPEKVKKFEKKEIKEPLVVISNMLKSIAIWFFASGILISMSFADNYYSGILYEDSYGVIDNVYIVERLEDDRTKEFHSFYNDANVVNVIKSFASSNTKPLVKEGYSYNYIFYDNFIIETKQKIKELMPDSEGSAGLEEYLERIKSLEADIEIATERRDSSYLTTVCNYYERSGSYRFEILTYLDMSAGTENADKEKQAELIRLSRTTFNSDTSFENVNILAYVEYTDGSRRFSLIKPTNIDELNSASSGIHYLKFSDEWGSYEVEITIN